jgi:hypothetical protein
VVVDQRQNLFSVVIREAKAPADVLRDLHTHRHMIVEANAIPVFADVDLDAAVVLSDWNVDSGGQIRDDFSDTALATASSANGAAAPLHLTASRRAAYASAVERQLFRHVDRRRLRL